MLLRTKYCFQNFYQYYTMDLDDKTAEERDSFWQELRQEAATCSAKDTGASRESLRDLLEVFHTSYKAYSGFKSRPPAADASADDKATFQTILQTLKSKMLTDQQAYKVALAQFRWGQEVANAMKDATASSVFSTEDMKLIKEAKKEAAKKKGESAALRFSPYKRPYRPQYGGMMSSAPWTASSVAPAFSWPGTPQAGFHSGSAANARYLLNQQLGGGGGMYGQFYQQTYRPDLTERKKTSQCRLCEEFGHWAKDGLCKPEDVQRAQARRQAAGFPALEDQTGP